MQLIIIIHALVKVSSANVRDDNSLVHNEEDRPISANNQVSQFSSEILTFWSDWTRYGKLSQSFPTS